MSYGNKIIGYLLNGTNSFIEVGVPAAPTYSISDAEPLGRWLNATMVRKILCLKKDAETIIGGFALEQVTVQVDGGVNYAGTEALVDWSNGWQLAGIAPSEHGPSMVELALSYTRETSARLELDLPTGLSFVATAGTVQVWWNGVKVETWSSDTGVSTLGLQVRGELSYSETNYVLADGTNQTGVTFTATVTNTVDQVPIAAFSVTEKSGYPSQSITTDAGDTRTIVLKSTYDKIRKELYWLVSGTTVTMRFWDANLWQWGP